MDVRVGLWRKLSAKELWCFWTVVLEKTLENPLDCKEFQPVHSEGDQPWDFFGRNDAKAETPVLWPPHVKSWLIGKDSDAGRDWGQEEKGTTEDEMAWWHHWLNRHESEWTPGVGDGQGGLACCDSWGRKESDTTERLNWTETLPIEKMCLVAHFYTVQPLQSICNIVTRGIFKNIRQFMTLLFTNLKCNLVLLKVKLHSEEGNQRSNLLVLPTSVGSEKKQESSRKTSTSA